MFLRHYLDVNLNGPAERGGDPQVVRESQRRRYADVDAVDKVIELDKVWREGGLRTRLCVACPFSRNAHSI